jgi:hypothetical protein
MPFSSIEKYRKNGGNKMKQIRNKVFMSAIVLAFAIIATIGTTFAWFTVSNTVQVDSLEIYVSAQDNLLIKVYNGEINGSIVPTDYKTTITTADIIATTEYADLLSYRMAPATAVNDTLNGLDVETLRIFDDLALRTYQPAVANDPFGNFIELKFWIMAQTATTKTLGMKNVFVTVNNSLTIQDEIEGAVFLGAWLDTDAAEIYRTTFADYEFSFINGLPGYNGNSTDSLINAQDLADLHVDYVNSDLGELVDTTPRLLTVRIYVEGWDAQTTNNVIASTFTISFVLEIK